MTQLEALKAIAKRNEGLLRPGDVVAEARSEASPLHGAFEWDDGAAAEKYRIIQAQRLIRSFYIDLTDTKGKVMHTAPVFIGLSVDRDEASANNPYRLASEVARSEDLTAVAERDALEQLRGVRRRYDNIRRLADVWDAIDAHR